MKKLVAILLSMSMVLAASACTKETEETKKKKKTKKTTEDTEDSDTSETDEPSDSDTSDTEDTTDTTTTAPVSTGTWVFDDTLEDLGMYYPQNNFRSYGSYDADSETGYYLVGNIEDFYFEDDPEFDALQDAIDEVIGPLQRETDSAIADAADAYQKALAAGEDPVSDMIYFSLALYREDSQVFSFAIVDSYKWAWEDVEAYNFRLDGTPIKFTDVVTDTSAFADYFESLVDEIYPDGYEAEFYVDVIKDRIKDGTIPFCLVYDGIQLFCEGTTPIKISAFGAEDMLNMEYFGKTPQYYSLIGDYNYSVTWDFNGDGNMDTVSAKAVPNGDEFCDIEVTLNGNTINSSTDLGIDIYAYYLDTAFVMYSDCGYHLYVITTSIDGYEDCLIFDINGDKPVYLDDFGMMFTNKTFIDPIGFEMHTYYDLLGTVKLTNNYTTVGYSLEGIPAYTNNYFDSDQFSITTKASINGKIIDKSTSSEIGDITIAPDTTVRCAYFDVSTEELILEVLNFDRSQNQLVKVNFEFDSDEWAFYIDGVDIYDLFYDIMFYG